MKIILNVVFGFLTLQGFSCDCKSDKWKSFKKESYGTAHFIFTATIGQELKPGQFEIEITEVFKGDPYVIKAIINPTDNYCFRNIKKGEKWLIYSTLNQPEIFIDECSRSRNIEEEKEIVPPPPPPRNESKKSQKHFEARMEKYLKSDKGDINQELRQLRVIKANTR
jgi:hypothetical protein